MAPIRHVFTSPQADVADPTLIRPSDWNQSHAATLLDAVSLAGNTAGVLANISSGTLILAGGNNVTLSQNGNSVTVSAAATAAQTEQTQSRFNLTVSGNTAGALALVSSGVLTLAGGNNVTLSQAGNAVTISGAATVAQTVQTQNIVNVTLAGNTAGVLAHISSGTMTLAGGDNITLSQAGNAITVVGAAAGTGGGGVPIATTVQSVASANSVGTVTRYAAEDHRHAGLYQISVGGNTAGGNTSAGAGSLMLAGGPNITLSGATAAGGMTLSISAATAAAGARPTLTRWNNMAAQGATTALSTLSVQSASLMVFPLDLGLGLPGDITISTLLLHMTASAPNSSSFNHTYSFGIYTAANSTGLSMLYQASSLWQNAADVNMSSIIQGARFFSFHSSLFSNSASAATTPALSWGSHYWGALVCKTAVQTKNLSYFGQRWLGTIQRSGTVGVPTASATNQQWYPFFGIYSSGSLPVLIEASCLNAVDSRAGFIPAIHIENFATSF